MQKIEVDGCVEKRAVNCERSRIAARVREELVPGLRALPAEERLLLKMCFRDGFTIADIAPILGRSQKELCSIRDRCLRKLRKALEPLGLSSEQVLGLVSSPLSELWEAWND